MAMNEYMGPQQTLFSSSFCHLWHAIEESRVSEDGGGELIKEGPSSPNKLAIVEPLNITFVPILPLCLSVERSSPTSPGP